MSESDIYRAGYSKAITDVCDLFDQTHANYVQAFKRDDTTEQELANFELSLVTLNTCICHLTTQLSGRDVDM